MNPTERPAGRIPAGDAPTDFGLSAEDARLLAELSALLETADPVPHDLATRTRFAMDLEHIDEHVEIEVARWAHEDQLVGVRGASVPNTITFTVGDLTVMISLAQQTNGNRFDGWLVPGGPHSVEVRVEGHEPTKTNADEGGRFALPLVPSGLTQILVHLAAPTGERARTVVTPTIVL